MRGNELLDKMALMDPAYVEAADVYRKSKETAPLKYPKGKGAAWMKWGSAAACVALAVFAGSMLFHPNPSVRTIPESERVLPGGIVREYKEAAITKTESAIVWPWEYQTISEQYTTLILKGEEFFSQRFVDASYIGEMLGTYDVTGFDMYTEQEHQMAAEVFEVAGVSRDRLVAVKLDDSFYVFSRSAYEPPENLGELLDDYTLEQTLPLKQFAECEGYEEKGYFELNDDGRIWEVLNTCRTAEFIRDDSLTEDGRSLSFTATSDALGAYKKVFRITESGYIWTNLFDYAYTFFIGRDAAAEIFSYAAENSAEAAAEPYAYSLAGTLTEITEEYIIVNDSIMCADEKDGMDFKIYLDDIRIRRHIEFEGITVGDVVVVSFTGSIHSEAGNVVEGAYSLAKGFLSDEGVSVPE